QRGEAVVHLFRALGCASGGAGGSATLTTVCCLPRATKSATRPEERGDEQTTPERLDRMQARASNPNKYRALSGWKCRSLLPPQFPIVRAVAALLRVGPAIDT